MKKKLITVSCIFTAIITMLYSVPLGIYADDEDDYPEDTMVDEIISEEDITNQTDTALEDLEEIDSAAGAAERGKITVPARRMRIISELKPIVQLGDTYQIKYRLYPQQSDDYVIYKSLNPGVAKVDDDGLVTAVSPGTAVIKAKTSKGCTASVKITVPDPYSNFINSNVSVGDIELINDNVTLRAGSSVTLSYILYPIGAYEKLTFTSDDVSVATVSSDGKVTGVSDGIANITLSTRSGITAVCSVSVYSNYFKGIDVSRWQDTINWKKVAASGIDFAMIRSSFGSTDVDPKLSSNVNGCEKYGIKYGFYHYTYAKNKAEAKREAKFFLKTIKNYSPEYPVVLDIEEGFYKSMSRKEVTDIIVTFMEELEDAGYYAMIYSNAKFFTDCVQMERLTNYDIWVACWGDEERLISNYDYHYGMWQYSATGKVSGIDGDVDLNYAFKNYPQRIRSNGLNNL